LVSENAKSTQRIREMLNHQESLIKKFVAVIAALKSQLDDLTKRTTTKMAIHKEQIDRFCDDLLNAGTILLFDHKGSPLMASSRICG
jgi:polyhydroxyalkanoate synthesis regulator phasin